MTSYLFKNGSITDILTAYLNICGIALGVAFLICLGLSWFLGEKRYFSKRKVFGLAIILAALLLLLRNLVLAFL